MLIHRNHIHLSQELEKELDDLKEVNPIYYQQFMKEYKRVVTKSNFVDGKCDTEIMGIPVTLEITHKDSPQGDYLCCEVKKRQSPII